MSNIGEHLFQLRPVGILTAGLVNIDFVNTKFLHQYLLPDGILLLGAVADIPYFHVQFLHKIKVCQ
ncbi:hypothetical protein SDC9_155685 [bioreactor metagenome]|uniref:Uncharacterized protein n=1 Tax=bioreactor metagenome TaxID=1076179 RepID=A0A645F7E4_9ZZZZ